MVPFKFEGSFELGSKGMWAGVSVFKAFPKPPS